MADFMLRDFYLSRDLFLAETNPLYVSDVLIFFNIIIIYRFFKNINSNYWN